MNGESKEHEGTAGELAECACEFGVRDYSVPLGRALREDVR
jgi:hypothetical protein